MRGVGKNGQGIDDLIDDWMDTWEDGWGGGGWIDQERHGSGKRR